MNPIPTIPSGPNRIFIGIPCDKHAQRQINELLRPMGNLPQDVRWVAEDNRHLTLAFLGNIPNSKIQKLIDSLDDTYQREKHFRYTLTRLTRFPGSRGRIIALVNGPDRRLDNLFQNTLRLLQTNNLESDQKAFRPHLTLGRIKRSNHVKTGFNRQTNFCLNICKIRLYQSTITESGSIYTTLKETQLG